MSNDLVDTQEAASILHLSPHTLDRWRWSGDGPTFVKLGRSIRYRKTDLHRFVEESLRQHTSEDTTLKT
jgi:predicted DNA-binding transcriptional regulator AlpA